MLSPVTSGVSAPAYAPASWNRATSNYYPYSVPPEAFVSQDSFESRSQPTRFSGAYGMQNYAVQQYVPIMEKRNLSPNEFYQVQQGQSQWIPKLFSSYATPLSQMMASPGKMALVHALGGALLGGLVGFAKRGGSLGRALGFGVIAAGLGGLLGYFTQQQRNENMLDMMQRLPANATKRDLLSDPAYQADETRRAMYGNNNGLQTGLLGAQVLASVLNNRD